MHTKWIATFLGLKLFAATVLIRNASCKLEEGILDIQRDFRLTAIHRSTWGNCTQDSDCKVEKAICELQVCRCSKNSVRLNSKCWVKVAIDQHCEFDQQCILDGCNIVNECRCNQGEEGLGGYCVKNEPLFSTQSGMMKVLIVITGFVIVATFTCIVTLLYRRIKPSTLLNRTPSRTPVMNVDIIEDGINPVPSLDSPPPLYEEVIKSGPSSPTQEYVNPPSYGEYLELKRKNSLQPMIEARNPRITVIPSSHRQTRINDTFIGRF